MGIWSLASRLLGKRLSARDGDVYEYLGGGETWAGESVTSKGALNLSAFWAGTRITAETVASLSVHVMENRADGLKVRAEGHDLQALLNESPNADQTSIEFWEERVLGLCTTGNGFAEKAYVGDRLVALNPMPADTGVRRNSRDRLEYVFSDRGKETVLPVEKVFHLKAFGEGDVGFSPVEYARQTLSLTIATEKAAGQAYSKGLRSKGFFIMPPGQKPMTPALTARRVLEFAGLVEGTDFLAADFAALHALNPAEVGWWTGTERADIATVVSALLDGIGAWIAPDSLGRFRVGRLDAPAFDPAAPVLDESVILDGGNGIERLSTSDEGRGVPAAKVTVRYARNWTVQTKASLDTTAATAAVKAFAVDEWRNAVREDAMVRTLHLLAKEPEFDSTLVTAAAAEAEAGRRLGIYGTRRDRYRVPLKAEHAAGIELGDVVTLQLDRFDLADGKSFVVIGEEPMLASGKITLDLYG